MMVLKCTDAGNKSLYYMALILVINYGTKWYTYFAGTMGGSSDDGWQIPFSKSQSAVNPP